MTGVPPNVLPLFFQFLRAIKAQKWKLARELQDKLDAAEGKTPVIGDSQK